MYSTAAVTAVSDVASAVPSVSRQSWPIQPYTGETALASAEETPRVSDWLRMSSRRVQRRPLMRTSAAASDQSQSWARTKSWSSVPGAAPRSADVLPLLITAAH